MYTNSSNRSGGSQGSTPSGRVAAPSPAGSARTGFPKLLSDKYRRGGEGGVGEGRCPTTTRAVARWLRRLRRRRGGGRGLGQWHSLAARTRSDRRGALVRVFVLCTRERPAGCCRSQQPSCARFARPPAHRCSLSPPPPPPHTHTHAHAHTHAGWVRSLGVGRMVRCTVVWTRGRGSMWQSSNSAWSASPPTSCRCTRVCVECGCVDEC